MAMTKARAPKGRWDSTLPLWRLGYTFIDGECERLGSDVFATRLLGSRTICLRGHEAARVFYDEERFERAGALPGFVRRTLTGERGVQTLDGVEHRHRRRMLTALTTPAEVKRLADATSAEWHSALQKWAEREQVVLVDEVRTVLCAAVCRWAGVPLAEPEARAQDMGAMIDGFGGLGMRQVRGRLARRRAESWISRVIDVIRAGEPSVADRTPAAAIATHRDLSGELLPPEVAAVDLLNVLRPVVAIATYVSFVALALHANPDWRDRIRVGDDGAVELVVQEVRRYYPFTPFVGARVRTEFEWQGQQFPAGTLTLLDVYGTLHDDRLWDYPHEFLPDRFQEPYDSQFALIPQGGGDAETGHRCAGEPTTLEIMRLATRILCRDMDYLVPPQDLTVDLSRVPTGPHSGFVISSVAPREIAH